MHPGWAETPAVAASLPAFQKITRPPLVPPPYGWQRDQDPATVARFLKEVSKLAGTPDDWAE
jgi:dehydrogenase/reductase SDR family member 12